MFIQVVQGRATDVAGWRKGMESWIENVKPAAKGYLGSTAGIRDDGSFMVIARFESEELAEENNNVPEQTKWYEEYSSYWTDVTFTNCTKVVEWLGGGSNDAGFVQAIQGKLDDPQKMIDEMTSNEDTMREERPDVIGGVIALHGDGGFTNTVYFTSEAEARVGEKKEDARARRDSAWEQIQDISFFDITEPILD